MLCAIWYLLHNFKNVKKNNGGVIFLVKFQTSSCKFTKSITPPWVFFTFFKLYKFYQIAQSVSNGLILTKNYKNCEANESNITCFR